jgi:hypothetical protein
VFRTLEDVEQYANGPLARSGVMLTHREFKTMVGLYPKGG